MKSLKVKLSLIIALIMACVAALSASLGLLFAKADRSVTVSGSSIFTSSGNAEVWAHEVKGETNKYYTMFVLKDDDSLISYKKNLAYKWFYNDPVNETEDKAPETLTKKEGYFNAEIGFELGAEEKLAFEKFVITFESRQYSKTNKDGKTVNYIVFYPTEDGRHVNVLITDEEEEKWELTDKTALDFDHIKINFGEKNKDEYPVTVSSGENSVADAFKNVGGTYGKYSSSTSNPVTPLSFKAEYKAAEEGTEQPAPAYTRLALYNLNGQSFEVTGATSNEGHFSGGTVNDNTPPVLCLDKGVSFIENGEEISFNYTVIDVLASSPSTSTSYFMLTDKNAAADDFNADDCSDNSPFRVVRSDDDQLMIAHKNHYVPKSGDFDATVYNDDFVLTAAVKIFVKLTDTTSTGGKSTYVLMDWYVDDDFLLTIKNNKYIAVAEDEIGATFAYTDGTSSNTDRTTNDKWDKAYAAYEEAVVDAAKDLKAGSKNYFYLPALDELLSDNATDYSDLTFSIFYMTDGSTSFQSSTGKAANDLSINLNKAGEYVFTVLATDAAGNKMYYLDENDEKVEIEASASNVLKMYKDEDKEGLKDYLPWFRFNVSTSEISIEDPGEQDTAYVGTEYTSISFDINGVSYETKYNLYLFKNDLYFAENGVTLTYDEFMTQKETLFKEHRNWFETIYPSSSLSEDDEEEYEKFNDYAWDSSSLSFIPQDSNAFYLVECIATADSTTVKAYMGIGAAPKVRAISGESTWLQDNLVSVILLCVAGVSLIGIVLLLVIRPKNKGGDSGNLKAVRSTRRLK